MEQDPENAAHLANGRDFAQEMGFDANVAAREVDDGESDQEQDVAAEHGQEQPRGQRRQMGMLQGGQQGEAHDEKQFVRHGVQHGSKFAALVIAPGNVSIDGVGDGGDGEAGEGELTLPFGAGPAVFEENRGENRNEQDAGDGDLVGGCHHEAGPACLRVKIPARL